MDLDVSFVTFAFKGFLDKFGDVFAEEPEGQEEWKPGSRKPFGQHDNLSCVQDLVESEQNGLNQFVNIIQKVFATAFWILKRVHFIVELAHAEDSKHAANYPLRLVVGHLFYGNTKDDYSDGRHQSHELDSRQSLFNISLLRFLNDKTHIHVIEK